MTHIFVGRKQELQQFEQVLNPRQKVAKTILGLRPNVRPHVFLPFGMGGMGKTSLSRECLLLAKDAGWTTLDIDWDRADTRPGDRTSMMNMIAERIKAAYQESAIKGYLKALNDSKNVQERVNRYRQENQEKWLSSVDAAKTLFESAGGDKGKAAGAVINGIGKTVNIGAASLAKAEDAFLDWMISKGVLTASEKLLYTAPEQQLAKALVNSIGHGAKDQPLCVLFDTCEVLPLELEEWLRDAIVSPALETNAPLIFIVSGRYDQYRERQAIREDGSSRTVKGYADRITDPPPIRWDMSRFADPEIAEYLKLHNFEPTQELVDFVQSLARGIPYAVQLVTDALLRLGTESVKENFPPENPDDYSTLEIVILVTRRFLRYCLDNEDDLNRVRGLAALRNWDAGGIQAVWKLGEEKSVRRELQNLESRYSFVLPDRRLHEIVRDFVREDLRVSEESTAREIGKRASEYYLPLWEEKTKELPTVAERVTEPRWRNLTLDTLNALCWFNEQDAIRFFAARVLESYLFDEGYASILLSHAIEFSKPASWCSARGHRIVNILGQLIDKDGKEKIKKIVSLLKESDNLKLNALQIAVLYILKSNNLYESDHYKDALEACLAAEENAQKAEDRSLLEVIAERFNSIGWSIGVERGMVKQSEDAFVSLSHAVQLQPHISHMHVGLGVMLRGLRKYEEAIASITKGITLGEETTTAYNSLGNAYLDQGRVEEAIAAYQKAIELDPKFDSPWNGLGFLYKNQGKVEEAIAAYQKAIELDPKYASPWNSLGSLYSDQGKVEEAIAAYQKAIELDPKYAYPWNNLASILYSNQGKVEEAIAAYQKAIELPDSLGQPASAHTLSWNALGILYKNQGKIEEAIAAYQKAIELDLKYASPWNNLGILYSDQGRVEEAIAAYQKAIELDPKYARSWNGLGILYKNQGKVEEAIAVYQKAIELDPKFASPWNGLGSLYSDQGKVEEAIAAYQKAIELDPKYAYPWNNLGSLYSEQGKVEEAIAAYQKAIELDPKFTYPWNGLGFIYKNQGKIEEAIAAYQKAIELDPKYARPWNSLGSLYSDQGKVEEAIAAYQKAIELDPKYAYPWNNLAGIHIKQRRFDEALFELKERIRLKPDNTFAPLISLGIIALYKELAESESYFQSAIAQWEKAWSDELQTRSSLLAGKSKALLCLGRTEEAVAALREALEQKMTGEKLELDDYYLLKSTPNPPNGIDELIQILEQVKNHDSP